MRAAVLLVAGLVTGCSLVQPLTREEQSEEWRLVCRSMYSVFGRSVTVYVKLDTAVAGSVLIDNDCRVTISATPPPAPAAP
jgi:hypothetical protein